MKFYSSNKVKRLIMIAFDIFNDKRRYKVNKILATYGYRIQYSIYHCFVYDEIITEIKDKLNMVISNEDKIIIYKINDESLLIKLGCCDFCECGNSLVI